MKIAEEDQTIPTEHSQPYSPIHDNYQFVSPSNASNNASPVADLKWKVSQMDRFNNNNSNHHNNDDAGREFNRSPAAVQQQRLVQSSMDSEHFDILGNTIVEMGDNSNHNP